MFTNLKRIKSDKYDYYASTWGDVYRRTLDGTYKKLGYIDKDGYMRVKIRREGKKKSIPVHRLIAEAFVDNPDGKKCIDHIDANKLNNKVENVRWCTFKENLQYREEQGITCYNGTSGIARNNPVKCTYDGKKYDSLYQLAKHLAVKHNKSVRHMCSIISKRRKHGHKLFGYAIETK